jgi:hypothetical protein
MAEAAPPALQRPAWLACLLLGVLTLGLLLFGPPRLPGEAQSAQIVSVQSTLFDAPAARPLPAAAAAAAAAASHPSQASASARTFPSASGTPTPMPTPSSTPSPPASQSPSPTPTLSPTPTHSASAAAAAAAAAASAASLPAAAAAAAAAPHALPRVALIINGRLAALQAYVATLSALPLATRGNLTLFLACYGDECAGAAHGGAPAHLALARALNASALAPAQLAHAAPRPPAFNSYTRGRNYLWRAVYAAEVARGARFLYWAVADADTHRMDCAHCPPTRPPDYSSAACCLDSLFGSALAANEHGFAGVGTALAPAEAEGMARLRHPRAFQMRDCTDGQLHALHRDAVPVYLPYHEDFEEHSIWSSQGLLFHLTSACTRGGGAVLGANLRVYDGERNSHTAGASPAAVDWAANDALLAALHPRLWGRVLDPGRTCQAPGWLFPASGDAGDSFLSFDEGGGGAAVSATGVRVAPRVRWNETCAFRACLAEREARFVRETGGGAPQAPRWPGTHVGWVWGWQALSRERSPWWRNDTSLRGITEECEGPLN